MTDDVPTAETDCEGLDAAEQRTADIVAATIEAEKPESASQP